MKPIVARWKSPIKVTVDNSLDKYDTSAFDKKIRKGNEILKKAPLPVLPKRG